MYLKFQGEIEPFCGAIRNANVIKSTTDFEWWKSFVAMNPNTIKPLDYEKINQLVTAVASSAGVERIFASFGQVHTKLRNKLGIEKAAKLTFLYRQLNQQAK